ncbi:MAG: ComEC/Rec2 family competence protein [Clostridia bacterium]|nr:ComEC/Rec2 family competence protein [Clostridia bacterium]
MKRPMATIGFSMLITFLLITNITHKMTVALLTGAIVIFSCFLIVKKLRKHLSIIFALFGFIVFTLSFISAEKYYFNEKAEMENEQYLSGIVCEMPKDSDYAFTYVIKLDNKNYKIRYVSETDHFLREGDIVKVNGKCDDENQDKDLFGNSLSSKVYFTFFESDECSIKKTGEINYYYKNIGAVKRAFSEVVTKYLPGRNGAIARAITIGDKSELDEKVTDYFNYCGTSHLLVISGLHLSLVSIFIVNFLNKFSKLRKYSSIIGLLCLLIYSAVTGFGVSVLRAGAMVAAVLVAKMFNRDADSINSIGLAVTFILLINPFAPFSAALWLSVLSTLGILAYSGKLYTWINEKFQGNSITEKSVYQLIVKSFSISFATMVFTLPVFIFKFKMVSVVSVLTNFLMVDAALVMMVSTFIGVLSHIIFLKPISQLCFLITGLIGEFLHVITEKIGMWEWSTISLEHKYYKYFFAIAIVCIGITLLMRKQKPYLLKFTTILLSLSFVVLTFYCVWFSYNTPTIEIAGTDRNPVITVNYNNETVLIGTQKHKNIDIIKDVLNKHNKKQPDMLVVTNNHSAVISETINFYNNFGKVDTYFYTSAPKVFAETSKGSIRGFSIKGNVRADFIEYDFMRITAKNKCVVIAECKNAENVFENKEDCDIIILYGKNISKYEDLIKENQNDVQVIVLATGEKITINL